MRQVIVKQWFESEGGYGRTPRYSLHPDEQACHSFASAHETDRLHPQGQTFRAEVDDAVFDQLESSREGMWFRGKVRRDGAEIDLGATE